MEEKAFGDFILQEALPGYYKSNCILKLRPVQRVAITLLHALNKS